MLGALPLVRKLYLVLNPHVAWSTRRDFGGWCGPLLVGDPGSVSGFGARLCVESVISNLETVVSSSLRSGVQKTPVVSIVEELRSF